MASIAKRSDGGWRARYRDGAGREHAKHFGRKVDAQRWLDVLGRVEDPSAHLEALRTLPDVSPISDRLHRAPAKAGHLGGRQVFRAHARAHGAPVPSRRLTVLG